MTIEAAHEAIDSAEETVLSWATGRCGLAANRDLTSPNGDGIRCTECFHLLDNVVLYHRVKKGIPLATKQTDLPLSSVTWNEVVFRTFMLMSWFTLKWKVVGWVSVG